MPPIPPSEKEILSISDLFNKDPWIRTFMSSVYDMFGMPRSSDDCMCKSDKIFFVYSMMSLIQAMKTDESWRKDMNIKDPEQTAFDYAKRFFEINGRMIIENPVDDLKVVGSQKSSKKEDSKSE